jgi:hypothetical protein
VVLLKELRPLVSRPHEASKAKALNRKIQGLGNFIGQSGYQFWKLCEEADSSMISAELLTEHYNTSQKEFKTKLTLERKKKREPGREPVHPEPFVRSGTVARIERRARSFEIGTLIRKQA